MEMAKDCVQTCRVLENVVRGRDAGNLSDFSMERMQDLERYVALARHSLPTSMSDIRVVRNIESVVVECASCARANPREHYPESTKECLVEWRKEMWEMLRALEVRDLRS